MSKKVLIAIADGSEEIEAVTIIDTLRRAGAEVTVAATGHKKEIKASRGVQMTADVLVDDVKGEPFDLIVLPGGMPGAERLANSEGLKAMLDIQARDGKLYAGICAAPAVVLSVRGLLKGKRATCYPAFEKQMDCEKFVDEPVVVDGNCVTSQGPGTALAFSVELVNQLFGGDKAKEIADAMLVNK
ncbi:Chaperone protein YajL [Anaerohalosphaera lusitana]|uniref:Chaperone protein YajL n=1 Tax=Anaerohalosphaera lusitana TaxID=1936003 RepID=A0A1U9NM01_9BACT|nr:DJ-1 family glyoxalase III [Anaerohalosphaera lusitana]AQT68961.1 Chaperone protein YajL [Anaerohalosphaera lusitana]